MPMKLPSRSRPAIFLVLGLCTSLGVGGCRGNNGSGTITSLESESATTDGASMSTVSSIVEPPSVVEPTTVAPSTAAPVTSDLYASAKPGTAAVGTVSEEWMDTPDGRRRHFRAYLPTTLRAGEPTPLLIALHGGLGSSGQFAANSGFDELAEANGFIVVYPDGIRAVPDRPGLQTWNGGYCCGPAASQSVDDVGYVRFLLDVFSERFEVDARRTFVAGHSNGAIMAYRLACELSDRIAAIGVQAGSLGIDECRMTKPVSVIHIHGLADTNHPIDGGVGTGVSGVEFRSGREAVRTLADLSDCDAAPRIEDFPPNPDVEISTWMNCSSDTEVRLITVAGAGHAWMGHAATSEAAAALVGRPYENFDSSRAIWSFLVQRPRD